MVLRVTSGDDVSVSFLGLLRLKRPFKIWFAKTSQEIDTLPCGIISCIHRNQAMHIISLWQVYYFVMIGQFQIVSDGLMLWYDCQV